VADLLDGLSNLTNISANIESLKQAQLNSAAATKEVDSYLINTEKNFSKMLDVLTAATDQQKETGSSDPLAYFSSDSNSALTSLTEQQNAIQFKQLAALEQSSALIGRTVTYYTADSTAQQTGVVSKVSISDSGAVSLALANGATIPVGAVSELK
jgi:flagellar hook protein FlgE